MAVDHHALPAVLENWLFPADGSTRDFETLQVILSSEDAFYASDRYGEVKSETSDFERKLRRATTINLASPAAENKRWVTNAFLTPKETERRRSSTLPSATSAPDQIAGPPPVRPQLKHIRSLSTDRPHRSSLMPSVARHRRMNWETRPRSHDELTTLKECPSPLPQEPSVESRRAQFSNTSHCSCGCHGGSQDRRPVTVLQSTRPVYADASIQTDDSLLAQEDDEVTYGQRPMDSTSSFMYEQNTQSQRTSFLSASTGTDSWASDGSWYVPNPVAMGRMQDYFRSNTYLLGDSLQPQGMG